MNEKKYGKKIEFQNKLISRQSEQIESLKLQIETLRMECAEKDRIIDSVSVLNKELTYNIEKVKRYKEEFKNLIDEIRKMKEVINQDVYKGRWKIVKFLIR